MIVRAYPSPKNTKLFRDISLGEYLLTCKDDAYIQDICEWLHNHKKGDDGYEEKKKSNRCATISCICADGSRKDSAVVKRNPLIVIDIDMDDNPKLKEEDARISMLEDMILIPSAYAAGLSCSGKGIYVIIYIGHNYDDDDFRAAYDALEEDFAEQGIIIDEKCKNISRLRFASSHTMYMKKPNKDIVAYDKRIYREKPSFEKHREVFSHDSMGVSKPEILREVIEMLIEHGYRTDKYNPWISCGFALQPFGSDGLEMFRRISEVSDKYKDYEDVVKKFGQLADPTITENDAYMKFFWLAKKIIGKGYYLEAQRRALEKKIAKKKK